MQDFGATFQTFLTPMCVIGVSVVLSEQRRVEIFLWSDGLHAAKIIQNPHLKEQKQHQR